MSGTGKLNQAHSQESGARLPETRVSMGMPVYNGERYLESSLNANLAQTFNDFTLFIADNASTDRTEEICRDYAAKDPRIVYIRNPINLGAPKNYARCFAPVTSPYYRWANSDDIPEPTYVEKCVKVLDADPGLVLAYGKSKMIDQFGAFMSDIDDNLHLMQDRASDRFMACHSQIGYQNVIYGLIRREPLSRTNLLGTFPSADLNLVVELSLYGKFREIPEVLFSRRMHPKASSWDMKDKAAQKAFWDPSKRKLRMGTWKSYNDYRRAVMHAPVPLADKWAISRYLLRRALWARERLFAELVESIR